MWAFLAEFFRSSDTPCTIIVMDDDAFGNPPRQYRIHPRRVRYVFVGVALVLVVLSMTLAMFAPFRSLRPGNDAETLYEDAREATLRLAALQDSLEVQQLYMTQLRQMLMGETRSSASGNPTARNLESLLAEGDTESAETPLSENWSDHQQPAIPVAQIPAEGGPLPTVSLAVEQYLPGMQLPALLPVNGVLTRGFDARAGHYAIDLAIKEGTMVRSVGEGYVVFADWTHEGGYAIIVQHAEGYLSLYKHNQRLLKQVGDRVHAREAIAVSGNLGEYTTGPHLHFELWDNGLAQDPALYLVGL